VTIALSLAVRPQFAIECLRLPIQQRRVTLGKNFLGCSLWSRSAMLGSAESEHPKLTDRGIIFEDLLPM